MFCVYIYVCVSYNVVIISHTHTHAYTRVHTHTCTLSAESLKSRLQRRIQLKLDDVVLEMMCTNYQRNQRLYLSQADVQFLQPSPSLPSEIISLLVPSWVLNPHALFFYMLQQLNQTFIKPQYTSSGKGERKWQSIVVLPELAEVLKAALLPERVQDDHLFLYIRPLTRGRGKLTTWKL